MTKLQNTILLIADDAKKNNLDPINAVKDYFDSKEEKPVSRAKVAAILAIAREDKRKGSRKALEAVK